ncbi:hypothetical protein ACFO9Q_15705 [Paenibacillus sp. GCM10023252]|uniref:hypothetical protein n=1 Tax=Paenibacillus sp. GCM10023252 TaxID=3252649 RepID=UPI003620F8D2
MKEDILNKYCVRTVGATQVVVDIGQVTKVASRTVHVNWGAKTYVYQNREFNWVPLSKEEFEKKYKKNKFSEEAKARALELGLESK